MSETFVRLDRVGNGYFMLPNDGRGDTVAFINHYVVGASVDFNTTVPFTNYTAVVAGASGDGVASMGVWMVQDTSDGTWHIKSGVAGGAAAFVKVMFVSHGLCDDSAPSVQA